jgi:hypothetical protein
VSNNVVTLQRTLPFNVSLLWRPKVYRFLSGISEVGIQDITIEMKWSKYSGHFTEPGFNGIEFDGASNCWAKNVAIL